MHRTNGALLEFSEFHSLKFSQANKNIFFNLLAGNCKKLEIASKMDSGVFFPFEKLRVVRSYTESNFLILSDLDGFCGEMLQTIRKFAFPDQKDNRI